MKTKFVAILIALIMVVAMAVPAYASTPALKAPNLPKISGIKINITVGTDETATVKLSENFWDRWFAEHPITLP